MPMIVASVTPPPHHFALSTAGVITLCLALITGVLVPVVLFQLARQDRRAERREAAAQAFRKDMYSRLGVQDSALNENTRALAVLVQRADDSALTLAKVPALAEAVAVLRSRMDQHDELLRTHA